MVAFNFSTLSTPPGLIQVVIERSANERLFEAASRVALESAIEVTGTVVRHSNKPREIAASVIRVLDNADIQVSPSPRGPIDIFDPALADHLLTNRHLCLRNPKVIAILKFRSILMSGVRQWFESNRYTEIDAPILTPVPLYDDASAMPIDVHGERVFLTQCVGYYLEAAV